MRTLSYTSQYSKVLEEREVALGLWEKIFNTIRAALWKIMETKEDDVKVVT